MSAQPPDRRSFQSSFPRPSPYLPGEDAGADGRRYFYRRLMTVSFLNDYYPPPSASPDFTVRPTAATGELLRQLGLLFRADASGFAILYDDRRKGSLLSFLRRQAEGSPPQPQVWTRLSFALWLDNPWFVNFTRLPLDFDPAGRNFYFSNQEAHRRRKVTVLNPGSHVTGDELLRMVPVQVPVQVDPRVEEVRVLDIAGETVLSQPRCLPDAQPSTSPPGMTCRSTVYLDFSTLPEGRYTIEEIGYGGEVLKSWRVLSTAAHPIPFGFVDLLLTRPRDGEPGIYPVRGLWTAKPAIAAVDYQLVFRRRATLWRYYIVLPEPAEGLRIGSVSPPRERFSGPVSVSLGDGTPASLFTARRPLPLQARPDVHLLLRSDSGVLLDPLPVAFGRQQVVPAQPSVPPPRSDAYSDIYVYV